MFCPNCGVEIPDNVAYCPGCGAKAGQMKPQVVYCRSCGAEISEKAVVCPKCGAATDRFNAAAAQNQPNIVINNNNANTNTNTNVNAGIPYSPKSKVVALLLCFFLGSLGVHRFYVGKIGTGILYLCTLGLCGIGTLVDFIMIAIGSFRDSMGLPLH